jgi:hypothetical protein
LMRTRFLLSGLLFCLVGAGIILYQVSESCENSELASTYSGYPWCSDVMEHINLTFVGVMAVIVGIIILALGVSPLWNRKPSEIDTTE